MAVGGAAGRQRADDRPDTRPDDRAGRGWLGLACAAGLLCAAASPPGWFRFAEFLVLPGLAAFYACATGERRPYLGGYLIGLLRLGFVAWSIRFVAGGATVAVVLLGAFYDLAVVAWTRGGRGFRLPAPIAFGLGIAATAWLRANMPEIPYPHGQASHALYEWPVLLGPVAWGGEVLANFLLAWTAAASVEVYRSWRVARPEWRLAKRGWAVPVLLWIAACFVTPWRAESEDERRVDVVAIEPGAEFLTSRAGRIVEMRSRLLAPTARVARRGVEGDAPDLVLWPESSMPPNWVDGVPIELAEGTRLLGGIIFQSGTDGSVDVDYSAALLLGDDGRKIGWQEKRVPVPAAERMPWMSILPEWAFDAATGLVGYRPVMQKGRPRPPLETADGVPFGTMLCFDNAFAFPAREQVDQGARFLAVLSNEIWYYGGAELDQMVAMTVFRALETRTPIVRSTVDGLTLHVDGDGRVVQSLGRPPPPDPSAGPSSPRFLRAEVICGPGALGPLAWLHPVCVGIALLSGVLLAGLRRHN